MRDGGDRNNPLSLEGFLSDCTRLVQDLGCSDDMKNEELKLRRFGDGLTSH